MCLILSPPASMYVETSGVADIVDSLTRARMMSGIKAKNTKPELQVRRGLHKRGFRYALHRRDLPGKPDLTLAKHHAVVFVHGCFWHAHEGCSLAKLPSTRPEFWGEKLSGNRSRDQRDVDQLLKMGWRVAVVWECALRWDAERTVTHLAEFLKSSRLSESFARNQSPSIE